MVAIRLKGVMMNTDQKLLALIEKTLDDNKAQDIVTIDLNGKTSIANFMVIASGTSNRHVASLADKLKTELKNNGYANSSEGEDKANWVLIDAFDVIVHIFCPEVREFYNLEKMWNSVAELRKN
jgi:ribosome-associated protein